MNLLKVVLLLAAILVPGLAQAQLVSNTDENVEAFKEAMAAPYPLGQAEYDMAVGIIATEKAICDTAHNAVFVAALLVGQSVPLTLAQAIPLGPGLINDAERARQACLNYSNYIGLVMGKISKYRADPNKP